MTTTADEWAVRITATVHATVISIIDTGRLLIAAKDSLPHGEWCRMFDSQLVPFRRHVARRYMAIARHPLITKGEHILHLPPSWPTLYSLTRLPPTVLESAMENGTITSKTKRSDVERLRSGTAPTTPRTMSRTKEAARERRNRIRSLAADGHSVPQIAEQIGLTVATVHNVVHHEQIVVPASRVGKVRRHKADRIVETIVLDAELLTADINLIDYAELDRDRLSDWIRSLKASKRALESFIQRLQKEPVNHVVQATDRPSDAHVKDSSGADQPDAGGAGPRHAAAVQGVAR